MTKWFSDVFLPSLFQRAGKNTIWLTRRQTAICVENMERHTVCQERFGGLVRHDYFTAEWSGRAVTLDYSKQNGCGTITFGATQAEQEKAAAEGRAEQKRIERERLERKLRRRPEQFLHDLEQERELLAWAQEDLQEDEQAGDEKAAALDRRIVAEHTGKIEQMEAVLAAG